METFPFQCDKIALDRNRSLQIVPFDPKSTSKLGSAALRYSYVIAAGLGISFLSSILITLIGEQNIIFATYLICRNHVDLVIRQCTCRCSFLLQACSMLLQTYKVSLFRSSG